MNNFINNLISKLKEVLNSSFGLRLIINATIIVIGSTGFFSFATEYATYSYSLFYGIRLPVEGVPYIKVAITSISFLLFASGGVTFFAIYYVLKKINTPSLGLIAKIRILIIKIITVEINFLALLKAKESKERAEKFLVKTLDTFDGTIDSAIENSGAGKIQPIFNLFIKVIRRIKAKYILLLLLIVFAISIGMAEFLKSEQKFSSLEAYVVVGSCYFYFLIGVLTIWKKAPIYMFSTFCTIIIIASGLALMFTPMYYAEFLRFTKFGGGIPIILAEKSYINTNRLVEHKAFLILRTSDSHIIMKDKSNQISEFPNKRIAEITYLIGEEWYLPSKKIFCPN